MAGYWAYATLNDAFTLRRRCRQEDAIYGLGEKSGRHNRKGRDFTLWNTDVLDPYTTKEFTAGRPSGDPRADRTSVEFDPYYVSVPFFYHQSYPAGTMAASFVDNGYRASYDFSPPDEYRIHFSGGQYTEYIFAGPGHAGDPHRVHLADRAGRTAAAVVVGIPPVPMVRLHPGRRSSRSPGVTGTSRSPATPCGWTSSTWTDTASSPGTPTPSLTSAPC